MRVPTDPMQTRSAALVFQLYIPRARRKPIESVVNVLAREQKLLRCCRLCWRSPRAGVMTNNRSIVSFRDNAIGATVQFLNDRGAPSTTGCKRNRQPGYVANRDDVWPCSRKKNPRLQRPSAGG